MKIGQIKHAGQSSFLRLSPRLGKKELVFVFLVHLFVCFAPVCFCPFSLPLCVEGGKRFVIVAYGGPFD